MTAVTADTASLLRQEDRRPDRGLSSRPSGSWPTCTDDRGQRTNQTTGTVMGAALGGVVGGLAFGSVGGASRRCNGGRPGRQSRRPRARRPGASSLGRGHSIRVRRRKQRAATYTVEPARPPRRLRRRRPPTVVSAKPVAPATSRADGSTCRPIELTATKNGQTTTETTTFCKSAGSQELKTRLGLIHRHFRERRRF